jgi:hypothetical protein
MGDKDETGEGETATTRIEINSYASVERMAMGTSISALPRCRR